MQPSIIPFRPEAPASGNGSPLPQITVADIFAWFAPYDRVADPRWKSQQEKMRRDFAATFGSMPVAQCIGDDLERFLMSHADPDSYYRRHWITAICTPFRRAERLGKIQRNPFAGIELGHPVETGRDFTDDEFAGLVAGANPAFRHVLLFCRDTGARPGEMARICPEHVEGAFTHANLPEHKTARKSGLPRLIFFTEAAAAMVRSLAYRRERGEPIFRNSEGTPWKNQSIVKNFATLRQKLHLPDELHTHCCRHTLAMALEMAEVSEFILRVIMGHSPQGITGRHYLARLRNKTGHIRQVLERVAWKGLR